MSENGVYSQWNSHLVGIMISKTIGYNGVHYFQTNPYGARRSSGPFGCWNPSILGIYCNMIFLWTSAEDTNTPLRVVTASTGASNWEVIRKPHRDGRRLYVMNQRRTKDIKTPQWISSYLDIWWHMGLSENGVPLHPMVLLIIIPIKWQKLEVYPIFRHTHMYIL